MEQNKIDMYILTHQKYFPVEKLSDLRKALTYIDESKFDLLDSIELKDPMTVFLISLFFGWLGIDRFMIGDIGMGVFKLLTGGVLGIFTFIDWFIIRKRTKERNYMKLMIARRSWL